MQCLDTISKMTEWSLFLSKANHSISRISKSMSWPVMLKKLKLNVSMKTYKTSRTNTPKRCPFHYRGLEYKSRKSRDNWTNKQIWLCSTKLSRSKANRVLQENALFIANTLFQQHKKRLYTWTSPYDQYWNQIEYILCSQRWRSSIHSAKTWQGADCGSDHELPIAKFRLKLKKEGKPLDHSGMT